MSSAKALAAILPTISSDPYAAHQKARTFAARYLKSHQYATAIDVLFQSARELFKAGQPGSGTDLTGFLLEVYDAADVKVDVESRGRITQLIALVGPNGGWRKTMIDKGVAWSVKHGDYPAGDPELHHYVGELLSKEGTPDLAEPHFLNSGTRDSARLLAEALISWAQPTSDYGVFALRGTIPYLLNGNILAAKTFITHFVSALPSAILNDPSTTLPVGSADNLILTKDSLVNFSQLTVLTCQRAQGDQNKVMRESWVRLCGTYQSRVGILASPEVRRNLSEIGTLYFAIPPPRGQAGNPLGDMLSSMFGGPPSGAPPARRMLAPAAGSGSGELD